MNALTATGGRGGTGDGAPLNACAWLLDRQIEAGRADRVALRCSGRDITYAALAELTARVAGALRRSGIRAEERVMLLMPDGVEFVATFLGAMRIGAVPLPVSTMVTTADTAFMAEDSRARALVADARFAAAAAGALRSPWLRTAIVCPEPAGLSLPPGVEAVAWEAWLAGAAEAPPEATRADDPGFWLYTSGTTGRPKAAMHRHADLPATALTYGEPVLGIKPGDRCLSVAKLFFAYGLGNSLTFPLSVGACAILEPSSPTPAGIAALALQERPTLFFATPTFYAALLAANVPDDSFSSVRRAVSAGEALPAPVLERFRARFGVEILDGIGSTEATHIFISNRPGAVEAGTSGVPVPGYEVRLVDDAERVVEGAGQPGHLLVRGESVATGYWSRAAVTRRTFIGEWLRTGDVYQRTGTGAYLYLGRSDDMIKIGGIWVSPAEVEAATVAHPEVVEAAVVGRVDADGITRLAAYVVRRPDATVDADGLGAHLRERLPSFKRPRTIVLVDELPKTATGKVQRFRLRDG